jgi:hypothetical protein
LCYRVRLRSPLGDESGFSVRTDISTWRIRVIKRCRRRRLLGANQYQLLIFDDARAATVWAVTLVTPFQSEMYSI